MTPSELEDLFDEGTWALSRREYKKAVIRLGRCDRAQLAAAKAPFAEACAKYVAAVGNGVLATALASAITDEETADALRWHFEGPAAASAASAAPAAAPITAAMVGAKPPAQAADPGTVPKRFPLVTIGLIAVLAVIYLLELGAVQGPASTDDAIALGAMNGRRVLEHWEVYRLLTAAMLHADAVHLLSNAVVLFLAGALIERTAGRAWLLTLFAAGACAGSVFSLLFNSMETASVGASGAIMCLLAALLAFAGAMPPGPERKRLQTLAGRYLLPALVPIAARHGHGPVDVAAHAGGAVCGYALAYRATTHPPDPRTLRRAAKVAAASIAVAALLVLIAMAGIRLQPPPG